MEAVRIKANFCRVIEEDSSSFIAETVAKAILRRIIDPFLDPDFAVTLWGLASWVCICTWAEARS